MRLRTMLFVLVALVASGVAAKPPIDLDEGRPHVSWEDADRVIGRVAFVSGRVADVRTFDELTLVNFFADHPPAKFSGVIRTPDLAKFSSSPKELFKGKIVRIRGLVTTFKGVPQIAITSPEQVEILAALPETETPAEETARPASNKFRFAEYNVLNLFDAEDDPYLVDEATPIKPRAELEALAKTIRGLDADVLALESTLR